MVCAGPRGMDHPRRMAWVIPRGTRKVAMRMNAAIPARQPVTLNSSDASAKLGTALFTQMPVVRIALRARSPRVAGRATRDAEDWFDGAGTWITYGRLPRRCCTTPP